MQIFLPLLIIRCNRMWSELVFDNNTKDGMKYILYDPNDDDFASALKKETLNLEEMVVALIHKALDLSIDIGKEKSLKNRL